ncbi:MAG: peroxide stress protein YaaA, partial [Flavobacteriaceae bacterium]
GSGGSFFFTEECFYLFSFLFRLKMISFFAKKARGMMVRYVLDNECNNKKDLLGFNTDGYQYSEEYTLNENQPVFIR